MSVIENLLDLASIYENLQEGFYTSGDFPLPSDKYLRNDPYISIDIFNNFRKNLEELDEILGGSSLLREILDLTEEDSPIFNLVNFNEERYADDLLDVNIEAYDEYLASFQEEAAQQAYDKKSELLDEALNDIKYLMEELLPRLIRAEN